MLGNYKGGLQSNANAVLATANVVIEEISGNQIFLKVIRGEPLPAGLSMSVGIHVREQEPMGQCPRIYV